MTQSNTQYGFSGQKLTINLTYRVTYYSASVAAATNVDNYAISSAGVGEWCK